MKKSSLLACFMAMAALVFSQDINKMINSREVERIERTLSADDMEGRKAGTPGIEKAALFIAKEFKKAGLKMMKKGDDYLQKFTMVTPVLVSITATVNGQSLSSNKVLVITAETTCSVSENSGYEKVNIRAGENLFSRATALVGAHNNYLVLVDTSFARTFSRLSALKRQLFKSGKNVIFLLTSVEPETYSFEAKHTITELPLFNVAGILPGKSKPDELVIFSSHYDHLGVAKPVNGDSIYNGANDDAAGTTGIIALAHYFSKLNNNQRTIVFVAFTAEESGGFGSKYFSEQIDAAKAVAMFNIEMIGTESKWGKNSAYVTGFEKTTMGEILQKNLSASSFQFYPDPYPDQQLFYRSDNATLARLGVPAHTISTSKMDSEPNYHKPSDEIGTLDMNNMAEIVKAIAISSASIIAAKDTPTRVNTSDLKR